MTIQQITDRVDALTVAFDPAHAELNAEQDRVIAFGQMLYRSYNELLISGTAHHNGALRSWLDQAYATLEATTTGWSTLGVEALAAVFDHLGALSQQAPPTQARRAENIEMTHLFAERARLAANERLRDAFESLPQAQDLISSVTPDVNDLTLAVLTGDEGSSSVVAGRELALAGQSRFLTDLASMSLPQLDAAAAAFAHLTAASAAQVDVVAAEEGPGSNRAAAWAIQTRFLNAYKVAVNAAQGRARQRS